MSFGMSKLTRPCELIGNPHIDRITVKPYCQRCITIAFFYHVQMLHKQGEENDATTLRRHTILMSGCPLIVIQKSDGRLSDYTE